MRWAGGGSHLSWELKSELAPQGSGPDGGARAKALWWMDSGICERRREAGGL